MTDEEVDSYTREMYEKVLATDFNKCKGKPLWERIKFEKDELKGRMQNEKIQKKTSNY